MLVHLTITRTIIIIGIIVNLCPNMGQVIKAFFTLWSLGGLPCYSWHSGEPTWPSEVPPPVVDDSHMKIKAQKGLSENRIPQIIQ